MKIAIGVMNTTRGYLTLDGEQIRVEGDKPFLTRLVEHMRAPGQSAEDFLRELPQRLNQPYTWAREVTQ